MGLDTGRFIDKCKQGVMQISLISFCKAKALAIHRLIGAQQSGSISFFAQTISGEEVPRKGTAGSSPWYAFASFPRIRKGRAPAAQAVNEKTGMLSSNIKFVRRI